MKLTVTGIRKHQSKLPDKGDFYYIFFKDEKGSSVKLNNNYRSCVYEKFGNYKRWLPVIRRGVGAVVEANTRGTLVDADSIVRLLN